MIAALADFHFLRPWWLLTLLGLPLLWHALRRAGGDAEAWRGVVDAHLLPHLIERHVGERAAAPNLLLALAWVVACIALAGPAWERQPQPLYENRAARVIALELAPSMLAQDVKPTRIERARYKIADILRRSGDAQTALIAYAGDAFVVAPITDDANTVANFVDALEPGIMPAPGTATARAIDLGARLVAQAGLHSGELLLVADAAGPDALSAAARAHKAGLRIDVLGIGTEKGAPVATAGGGFLQDAAGNIAMPRLDAAALRALADAGGGRYATYTSDARDLDALLDDLAPLAAGQAVPANAQTARFLDRGPWLLLALLPLAALGFRRGWLMLVPLVAAVLPQPAQAFTWNDLWSRPDQQAQAALDAGDAARAQALARDPSLRGSAAYRAEDYAAAADDFARREDAESQYNLGNALAKQQKYRDALAAYDRALKQRPDFDDAIANRAAVEDWLKQQKQDDKGKDKPGSGGDDQRQSKSGEQPDDKQAQASADQQQRGDQQNGEGQDADRQKSAGQDRQSQQQGDAGSDADAQRAGESQDDKNTAARSGKADNDPASAGKATAHAESKAAEQQAQQQFSQTMDQALKNGAAKPPQPLRLGAREDGKARNEKEQAVDQWLQRVPDDPGGLLRRKFQLEAQRREQGGPGGGSP